MITYGEKHHMARYSDETVELARALNDEGLTPTQICAKLSVPYHTVLDWLKYRTRTGMTSYNTMRRRGQLKHE